MPVPHSFTEKATLADADEVYSAQSPFAPDDERRTTWGDVWGNYIRPKLPILNIADYNPAANLTDDDTPAFTAALADLDARGGQIFVPARLRLLLDTTLTLPENVEIVGERGLIGDITPANLLNYGPLIYIGSGAKIVLDNCSALRNLAIIRDGLTFNISQATVVSSFVGTGVEIANSSTEAAIENCAILGFEYGVRSAVSATNVSRVRMWGVNIDCINGVYLENSYDITYLSEVHCWPFVTVNSTPETGDAHLYRSGAGIYLSGAHDWTRIHNCFSYGYAVGIDVNGSDSVSIDSCGADHAPAASSDGSIGFRVRGDAFECKLINCQTAAKQHAYYFDTTATNNRVNLVNCNAWEFDATGVYVAHGRVEAVGCDFRRTGSVGTTNGYYVANNSDAELSVIGGRLKGVQNGINSASASRVVRHQAVEFDSTLTNTVVNPYLPSVASASTLALNGIDTTWSVTGTTNITAIANAAAYVGKTVTLIFAGALTVEDGSGLNLIEGRDFTTAADAVLTLRSDGTNWFELARSTLPQKALSTNLTLYVATTGSDSNDGLTVGAPFLTWQKAVDVAYTYFYGASRIDIQIADGTYTAGCTLTGPCVGANGTTAIRIIGNQSNPQNVILSVTSADAVTVKAGARLTATGFEVRTTTSGQGLRAEYGGVITLGSAMRFGAVANSQLYAYSNGSIFCRNSYTISGSCQVHAQSVDSGVIDVAGNTVTLSGTPNFSAAFVSADRLALVNFYSNTFSGSGTGIRYSVNSNGVIFSNGGGATYYPGNASGSAATGGQYI